MAFGAMGAAQSQPAAASNGSEPGVPIAITLQITGPPTSTGQQTGANPAQVVTPIGADATPPLGAASPPPAASAGSAFPPIPPGIPSAGPDSGEGLQEVLQTQALLRWVRGRRCKPCPDTSGTTVAPLDPQEYLRVCNYCGQRGYFREGVCLNEACSVS